jgi:Tfp pilus assembly protein PilN
MIQFNLLPNVKAEFIKVRKTKRLVLLLSSSIIGISLGVVVILAVVVFVWQNQDLKNLDKNIKSYSSDLRSQTDINKVLTVQNQLSSIDRLHGDKPEVARVFEYLTQVTPSKITVATLSVDFVAPTVSITGQAPSLEEVNKYVDTLKFTTIGNEDKGVSDETDTKAFSQVVLSAYSLDIRGASFTISLAYDPKIFDSSETNLKLTVP